MASIGGEFHRAGEVALDLYGVETGPLSGREFILMIVDMTGRVRV
jgi:hypothetical protein